MSSNLTESEEDPFFCSHNSYEDPDYVENPESTANMKSRLLLRHVTGDDRDDNMSSSDQSGDEEQGSSSTEKTSEERKGKKGVRTPSKWKRNQSKLDMNKGNEYINSAGRLVPAKKQGPRCECKQKCYDKFTELERDNIFTQYYSMGEKHIQDSYLGSLIVAKEVKRRRKESAGDRKQYSYYYYIKIGTKNKKVCRSAFCNLHAIGRTRVMKIALTRASGGFLKKDGRGTHHNRPNKIPEETVMEHIKSFPTRDSHYSRNDNKKKAYLPAELTVKKMHELYLQKYELESYRLLKDKQKVQPKVSYDFYYRCFTEKFNISFGYPRSDTCSTCDHFKTQMDSTNNQKEKESLAQEKELHLRKAQAFCDNLKAKTELAKTDETVEVICFDYEQNLPFPVLTTSQIFYARQIWVFNQCFHSCSDNKSVHYMFDETTAKKGCIETISFLYHFIEKYVDKRVTTLYIFTDNCAGQNKNAVMVHFLMALVGRGRFLKIVHHLPEPGHSFSPCDRDFGQIERKKRKKELLYVPEEWYSLVELWKKIYSGKSFSKYDI